MIEKSRRALSRPWVTKFLIKLLLGIFILAPMAFILTQTFSQALISSLHHGLLRTQSFDFFVAGMLLFSILFLMIPRKILMLYYVFGHEVTHAIWIKIFGGKVANHFHVSFSGGHVLSDRINTWISLAPYFFPFYSILVLSLYGASSIATDLSNYHWLISFLIGLTLSFHLAFTCILITKGQTDLQYGGTFFSLMVIYIINLLIITMLLLANSPNISIHSFTTDLIKNSVSFTKYIHLFANWLMHWIFASRVQF